VGTPNPPVGACGRRPGGSWAVLLLIVFAVLSLGGCASTTEIPPPPLTPELIAARYGLGTIRDFVYSTDGKTMGIASETGRAYLYNVVSRRFIAILEASNKPLSAVSFTPDGATMVAAGEDGTLSSFATADGARLASLDAGAPVHRMRVGSDGLAYAGTSDGRVVAWDLKSKQASATQTLHTGAVTGLVVTAGKVYTGGADRSVASWSLGTLAAASKATGFNGVVTCMAASPDGAHVFCGTEEGSVVSFATATLAIEKTWTDLGGAVSALTAFNRGESLLVGGASRNRTLKWWNAGAENPLQVIEGSLGVARALSFTPDGERLAAGGDARLIALHPLSAQPPGTYPEEIGRPQHLYGATWSPDDRWIAGAGSTPDLLIWEAKSKSLARIVRAGEHGSLQAVAWSQKFLATGGEDGAVRLFDETGKQVGLGQHDSQVNAVVFSPDGKQLASAGWDAKIRLWTVSENGLAAAGELKGHRMGISAISYAADGKRIASSSWDHTVRVWDVAGARETLEMRPLRNSGPVFSVAWAPDSATLAIGGWHGQLDFYNADDGSYLAEEKAQKDLVSVTRFAAAGKILATGSADRTVLFWNPTTRKPLPGLLPSQPGRELIGFHGGVRGLSFTRDSKSLAIAASNGDIYVLLTPESALSGAAIAP